MKKILFSVLRGVLNLFYAVMKVFSIPRDRVLFISRQSDSASEDFLLIAEEIRKRSPNTELRFSCKKDKMDGFGFKKPFLMLDRIRLLAAARVCITDSESAELGILRHRKELRIIQIWHSMAPFKKFGWQTVGTAEGIPAETAEGIRYHEGYDHIIVGSEFARDIFAEAMKTEKSKILPLGIPVTDSMIGSSGESERFKLWKLHPSTCGKKIIVYAPTVRADSGVPCDEFVKNFDYENNALVIKLHPRDTKTVICDERAVADREMTTQEAVRAADIIITDYSGVAAEASLLGKPVFFYTPDIGEYSGNCGLNIDPSVLFPNITYYSAEKLLSTVCGECDGSEAALIREKLAGACVGSSAKSIANLAVENSIQTADSSSGSLQSSGFKVFISKCVYTVKYLGYSIDPMLMLFESKQTHSYAGTAREVYESMQSDKKFADCRFAWAVSDMEESSIPYDGASVLVVKFGSSEHKQLHARAGIIISDAPVSPLVRLRSEQNYFIADSGTKESVRRIIS